MLWLARSPYNRWPQHTPFYIRLRENDPHLVIEFLDVSYLGSRAQQEKFLILIDHQIEQYLYEPSPGHDWDVHTHGVNIVLRGIPDLEDDGLTLPLLFRMKEAVEMWGLRDFDARLVDKARGGRNLADFEVKLSIF